MSMRKLLAAFFAAFAPGVALIASNSVPPALARQEGWHAERRGHPGKDLNALHFVDSKRGWVAGDGGLVLRTEDGGRSWIRQIIQAKESINDIYFRDRDDGYLLAGNQILVTEDSGATWRAAGRFPASNFDGADPELYSVRFTSKNKGWVVGSLSRRDNVVDSLVLYTSDAGAVWKRLDVPAKEELIHLDFDGDKRGWIVGAGGTILHTRDAGETWTRQESGTRATLYHVDFRSEDRGWTVGARGTILRTDSGGETWAPVASPVQSTFLSVKFGNDREGWIVGRGGVILRSEDGGETWIQQESNTKENIYALFLDKKFGWAVGGDGTVLRYER
jgi:photosystem II stability/assembly factor-like uncharacterized protein